VFVCNIRMRCFAAILLGHSGDKKLHVGLLVFLLQPCDVNNKWALERGKGCVRSHMNDGCRRNL